MLDIVKEIIRSNLHQDVQVVHRFETGYCHYVYYVKTSKTEEYVVRLSKEDTLDFHKGSLYWLKRLEPLNIPIPRILHYGSIGGLSYTILTYFPGNDLGHVYGRLSDNEKLDIIKTLTGIQKAISALPEADGFGYLFSYDDPYKRHSWRDVLQDSINRSRERIRKNGIFDATLCCRVDSYLQYFDEYFRSVRPKAFLDDTTTKNVLIDNGKLSGIVDIDAICFGDSLLTVALTNMALKNSGWDTKYVEYWMDELELNHFQRLVVCFYTLLFCLDFIGEKGMCFNKVAPLKVSEEEKERLLSIYASLTKKLDRETGLS